MVSENPLNEVRTKMAVPGKTFRQEHKEKLDEIGINDKQKNFQEQLNQEFGDTIMVDDATGK